MDYVGILIERNDGKMLFQLRDNNPNIRNRNCWGLFGGGINKSETPIGAAVRELKEELGIKIEKKQLHLWAKFPGIKKKSYIFRLKLNKNIKSLKLMEGTSMGYFTKGEILRKGRVVKSLRLLIILYYFMPLFKSAQPLQE